MADRTMVYGYRDGNGYIRSVSWDRWTAVYNGLRNGGTPVFTTVPAGCETVGAGHVWRDLTLTPQEQEY